MSEHENLPEYDDIMVDQDGTRWKKILEYENPVREDYQFTYQTPKIKIAGAGKDAPTTTNDRGGKQSHIAYRFDLMDGPAISAMAAVLHEGAEKYEPNNWRKIDVADHLNHALLHIFAYLAGDTQDDHLSHLMCRAMFAEAVELQGGPIDG